MFDVEVSGDEAVIKNLSKIAGKSKNLAPAFQQISSDMLKSHQINFQSHGTRFGSRWPARKYIYPWEILHKTGKLSRGFKNTSTNDSATVTNIVSYAKFHQLGTRKLPIRNLIGLAGDGGKTDINEAIRTIRKHLELENM